MELSKAINDYEEMLVRFRVKTRDDSEISTPGGRRAEILVKGRQIFVKEFKTRSKRLEEITKVFADRNLLEVNERRKNIELVKQAMETLP